MDEPFGAIDPITRDRLQDDFLRLHREVRKTIIFVTRCRPTRSRRRRPWARHAFRA